MQYLLTLLIVIFSQPALASFKSFSAKLTKVPPKKVYKVKVRKAKTRKISDAILWHTPSHRAINSKLSPGEALARDELALQYLLDAAVEINEDLARAKSIVAKRESLVFKLGQVMFEENYDREESVLSHLGLHSNSKEEATSYINKVSLRLYQRYQSFKLFYKPRVNRDINLLHKTIRARQELVLISGEAAVREVESLWSDG